MKRLIVALVISGAFAVPYGASAGQNTQNPAPPAPCSQNNPCEPAPIVCTQASQNECLTQNVERGKKYGHAKRAAAFASR